ncbi:uncharacterized protein MKK02DRAFT_42958 [Dioszegia hungarica]|uniref:Uncharacterized protein n=1 Tax=Dioszegia hungarica TaxID=4972 RepID=A0AA38HGL8_9TREE|nr:uncharacterized protein MKK02DRAFT_42958 [Dioszegia hungarica]KAI9638559.1 hypothetical protein MKK02DRAFT_42958 [Dioszegia hungarica]
MPVKGSDIILILVAIIFPPAAAGIITGCSCDLFINICLTVLGYLPFVPSFLSELPMGGHIHAFWLIYKKIKAEEYFGPGGYEYLGNGEFQGVQGFAGHQGGVAPPQAHYGATR